MLSFTINQLEQPITQIEDSGVIADVDTRLDVLMYAKSGYEYGRLRSGSKLNVYGLVGSKKYCEVLATLHAKTRSPS